MAKHSRLATEETIEARDAIIDRARSSLAKSMSALDNPIFTEALLEYLDACEVVNSLPADRDISTSLRSIQSETDTYLNVHQRLAEGQRAVNNTIDAIGHERSAKKLTKLYERLEEQSNALDHDARTAMDPEPLQYGLERMCTAIDAHIQATSVSNISKSGGDVDRVVDGVRTGAKALGTASKVTTLGSLATGPAAAPGVIAGAIGGAAASTGKGAAALHGMYREGVEGFGTEITARNFVQNGLGKSLPEALREGIVNAARKLDEKRRIDPDGLEENEHRPLIDRGLDPDSRLVESVAAGGVGVAGMAAAEEIPIAGAVIGLGVDAAGYATAARHESAEEALAARREVLAAMDLDSLKDAIASHMHNIDCIRAGIDIHAAETVEVDAKAIDEPVRAVAVETELASVETESSSEEDEESEGRSRMDDLVAQAKATVEPVSVRSVETSKPAPAPSVSRAAGVGIGEG